MSGRGLWLIPALAAGLLAAGPAAAQYKHLRSSDSEVDSAVFRIDERAVLGVKVDGGLRLRDETGAEFRLADRLGRPLVLVLSYYTCDGSCSVVNANLAALLGDLKMVQAGRDFGILTVSFDRHDTLESTGAFRRHVKLSGGLAADWTFATLADPADIPALTEPLGYRYFWSPRDRTFFHPGAFLFLTPEGRLSRVLYAMNASARDVELAILDARQGQTRPGDIVNLAVSLCYSFNYAEGRYTYNIPLFIAGGSFFLGIVTISASVLLYRRRRQREVAI
jgi:protein SCO1/2